ncbi:hypothetical protein P9112_000741 [Eukaryota sp. TZLM1-RC]
MSVPSSPAKRQFPSSADAYQIVQELGSGASATVYRAYCEAMDTEVAIKVVNLESSSSSMDEIRKELNAMSLNHHPNIVTHYVSFVHKQSLWLVMPLLLGSLRDIMKVVAPNGFDEITIATILRETLKALEYLHRNDQVHRDIKAGNILLDRRGSVYLGDFGVCGLLVEHGARKQRNTFVGTPCWMAPEVIEQRLYSESCDIWSLGISAIELAHGVAPYSKYPPMKVVLMTIQNPPPSLDSVDDADDKNPRRWSRSFKEFVDHCLNKDPTKRANVTSLLNHRFIKNMGKKADYLVSNVVQKYIEATSESFTSSQPSIERSESPDYYRPIGSAKWDFGDLEEDQKPKENSRPPTPQKERAKRGRFTVKDQSGDESCPPPNDVEVEQRGRFALKSTPKISSKPPESAKEALPPKARKEANQTKDAKEIKEVKETVTKDEVKEGYGADLRNQLVSLTDCTLKLLEGIVETHDQASKSCFLPHNQPSQESIMIDQLSRKNNELSARVGELLAENSRLKAEIAKLTGDCQ